MHEPEPANEPLNEPENEEPAEVPPSDLNRFLSFLTLAGFAAITVVGVQGWYWEAAVVGVGILRMMTEPPRPLVGAEPALSAPPPEPTTDEK